MFAVFFFFFGVAECGEGEGGPFLVVLNKNCGTEAPTLEIGWHKQSHEHRISTEIWKVLECWIKSERVAVCCGGVLLTFISKREEADST